MTKLLRLPLCASAALAALSLVACGDDQPITTASAGSSSTTTMTTATPTSTTVDPTVPNPTTSATETGGTGNIGETLGTTGTQTTGPDPSTSTSTTGPDTTGGSTGDNTTGEDPNFGEIPEDCDQAELSKSTVGCLFYAIDMDSHDLAETGQYAVAVANVQTNKQATVTIERKQNGVWNVIAGPANINALGLQTFNLPDQHTDDSQLALGFAYRVKSTVPVIAYQFNPVDGGSSFLSDAAMLYPVTGLDSINHAITFTGTTDNTNTPQHNYASAVAVFDGTKIKVTPKVATKAGAGVPAGQPGVPFEVMLNEGDVLSVAVQNLNSQMTGTIFESDKEKPFMLFAGLECALIPVGTCCCDHMEEQISGVRLWGKNFVAARMPLRNMNQPESALWQIYAAEDDTTITLTADAQVTGLPANPIKLNKGQVVEFYSNGPTAEPGDFLIDSDKPIGVMHYMTGAENMPPPFSSTGDPAAVQIPSVQQALPRYVVLVPGTWINDFGVFTRKAGAIVQVDGVPIPDNVWNPIGGGEYEVARVPLGDGVHFLDGMDTPFSVYIVGFDQHDSYAYLGGTGTKIVNPVPM